MSALRQFPALAVLLMAASTLMLVPALYGARIADWPAGRTFLYHALFFLMVAAIVGIATMNRRPHIVARYELLTLLLAYLLLPIALAMPLLALVPTLGFSGAYFEMLSSLTTTGATLFPVAGELAEPLHLWRALVGWAGGLMILVAAGAVLAPLHLGGFEILRTADRLPQAARIGDVDEATARVLRTVRTVGPIYTGVTLLLAFLLILAGDRPFVAFCHAMSTLSTSGISPVGGVVAAQSGVLGEVAIAVFLLSAVSHRVISVHLRRIGAPGLTDPQVQLMLISVLGVTVLLFLRNYIGAIEIARQDNIVAALEAVWGALFTVLSFLTTAGFVSRDWVTTQYWSGLEAPGIILLGVAMMGGGIATTAGGIKLLRLYALYRHGLREMDVLVHPSAIGRRGVGETLISPSGARVSFIFLMLFLIVLALVMGALAATGLAFEASLSLAVATLTTTGPAIDTLGHNLSYADLATDARWILCAAMVLGRMEILVIVALFNPAYWRR
jgi:trk system potassium uptake protein